MKKNSKRTVIIIAILIVLVAIVTGTSAKYVYNSVWSYYLTSKEFYFESDLLTLGTKKNAILNWDGTDVSFVIKNNNDLSTSEFDISYKIACEVLGNAANYLSCNLNGTGKNEIEGVLSSTAKCVNTKDETDTSKYTKAGCEIGGYSWNYDLIQTKNSFNFIMLDETKKIDEVSVKVTVESTKPYKKILTGVFHLNKVEQSEREYNVEYQAYSNYDELTIINNSNATKCFLIGFDSNDYVLNTLENEKLDIYTDAKEVINGFDIKIANGESLSYNFYKLNKNKNYSIDDFMVTEKEC